MGKAFPSGLFSPEAKPRKVKGLKMELREQPTKWSPGNQFCFLGDGYAYSVDQQLRTFRILERGIISLLDGSKKHGNPVIDNLITLDINQRSQNIKNSEPKNKRGKRR